MRKKILTIALAVVIGAALASLQALTQQQAPPALTMEKTKDDLYTIIGDGGNVAVLVTNEGVLLIDDKFEQDHDQIVAKVKSVTNQPIKYVINTHYHADHSGGNGKMVPMNVEIISTANSRKNILEHRQSNAPPNVVPARLTFTEETSVFIGGKEVRARYFGRGHTNGDAVIYFPADRTVHTGDLMAGTSPLIDYNGGGSLIEWTKTLDGVLNQLDFDTVIPGHGNVTNKAGLKTYRDNVEKLRNRVTGLIREGKAQGDIAKVMQSEYGWAPDSLQQQWSVPGFMKELK
jgi:glyoxylase-like metal-dependent hydrolase (beta-lactamase superfamily II)